MRSSLTKAVILPVIAGWLGVPSAALAWGKDGHQVVGKVAHKHLTSKARNAIDELLQDHQFQSLADSRLTNWADTIKSSAAYRHKYPKMNQWHYIDVDVHADLAKLNLTSFCLDENCALGAIKRFRAVLKDSSKSVQDRRESLFFLAHIIGDIHQPLHCAERNNDKGGNLVRVHLPDDTSHVTNLHKVWDTDLVEEAMGTLSSVDYATRLTNTLSTDRRKAFQKGTIEDWIIDSHKIARTKVYTDRGSKISAGNAPHKLSEDYIQQGAEIVEEQLTKGGVRLAQFLNDAFKE